ncbi:MAG TPA: hypothetical protein VJQ56_00820 [Blastocatellia bacterium]|nr:hypothetical protein [Blastocatellia bacterium]
MRSSALLVSLFIALGFSGSAFAQSKPDAKQLFAVRGEVREVKRVKSEGKQWLLITVRPPRDFPEVAVFAQENDIVGSAAVRGGGGDLLDLLTDDQRGDEAITAAELGEGDVVSVIYDPRNQNRAIEIYIHR